MNGQGQIGKNDNKGNQQQVTRPNFQFPQTFNNQAVRYNVGNNTGAMYNRPPTSKFSEEFMQRLQNIKSHVDIRFASNGGCIKTTDYYSQMRKEINRDVMLHLANANTHQEVIPQKVGPRDDSENEESDNPVNKVIPLWPKTHIPNSQEGRLTHQHFWTYSNSFDNPQYASILFGFNTYIEKSRYELNQPTRDNVVKYLAQTAVAYNKIHQDNPLSEFELNQWINQLKDFFGWTSRQNIYSNIASDISYQDITNKMTDIINYPTGENPNARTQKREPQKRPKVVTQSIDLDARLPELNPDCINSFVTALEASKENQKNNGAPANEKKTKDKGLLNEESRLKTFLCYLKEQDLKSLNKRDMLKFLVRYRDINTESTMNENVITLKRLFRWISVNKEKNNGVEFPYIESFVPDYDETCDFAIKTIIEGNAKLGKASFNSDWVGQFLVDIKRANLFSNYDKPISHIKALQEYLDKKTIKQPSPCDILDFLILEKSDIAEGNMHRHISTYQRLFKWTSIKANDDGSMCYPDIIGLVPKPGILGDLVYTLKEEYNERVARGENPKSPTAEYFNAFKGTVSNPDNGKIAINFINFIEYLRTHVNIRKAPPKLATRKAKGQQE